MKKRYLLIIFIFLLLPSKILANTINDIDMSVYIDNEGTAHVTEVWNVEANKNTEFYKQYKNLVNSSITNFKVSMNNSPFTEMNWDINKNFDEKAYKYGYNYISDGVELCFGISKYASNIYTLTYDINNFIYNTSDDYQIIYWNFVQPSSDKIKNVYIKIYSDFKYEDTLDVWGYGKYGMPAYVYDGYIEVDTDGSSLSSSEYITLLVKFPNATFNTSNNTSNSFDSYLNMASVGAKKYKENKFSFGDIFSKLFSFGIPLLIVILGVRSSLKNGYGYKGNKVIKKGDVPFFRDIPCEKNIYLANTLAKLNKGLFTEYKETNIFGSILLRWIKDGKIKIITKEKGIFNKETSSLDLTLNPEIENVLEKELFDIMYEASRDGILETKELERWCSSHYTKFFNLFERINKVEIEKLKGENHIYNRTNKEECKRNNVMDDYMYEESTKLCGLEKYLREFSKMDTKEAIEVHLWDEYLMFAYIFGIADKVAKQFKHLYPEVLKNADYDFDTFIYIGHISSRSFNSASSARSRAQSYSSGGGGFSSGGGGGGSFGGGGSMGSR